MRIKRVQDVGIQYFEVIYEEQVMAHIQNHTKNTTSKQKIAPFFLLSSEKWMLLKRFQDVGFQNFEVIYAEQVMPHIQNHTNHDFET
jgi:hypothetical protein